MCAEMVFDQKVPTRLQVYQHAFEFLGGVLDIIPSADFLFNVVRSPVDALLKASRAFFEWRNQHLAQVLSIIGSHAAELS